jgi:ATP-dependent Clp protease adapter protein ClpS
MERSQMNILTKILGTNSVPGSVDNDSGTTVLDCPPVLTPDNVNLEPKKPSMWAVLLHNDDTTDPEFVITLLQHVFSKNETQSYDIMMRAHKSTWSQIDAYVKEIAEQKLADARLFVSVAPEGANAVFPDRPCELSFSIEEQPND